MGKHREKKRYRRIVIAAVTMSAVGVPAVAMACADWQDNGQHHFYSAKKNAAKDWRNHADRARDWNGDKHIKSTWGAPKTATPSASTPKTTAPQTTAPTPRTTASPSTPKATATAPAPASATPTSPSTPKATATASGAAARVVELVNAERSKAGCSPLTLNATLTKAAQAHSEDMAAHQNMSHTGSDGSSPGDRITRAGYNWSAYGENVAYGYATPEQVMAGWMSSPGHKANILNCGFKEIGVGLAQPNNYWTQDFGTAR
ncbi:CAP domain-containing protein [Streptomyces yaanensis]|uniref:CAP domain-containing protein n=1 Tax=Streptomyces yaanensis TaxID=1142239 RepID=A0ABV7S7A5_9ACTN|nr:CAP domain-containing protein [Streptomyces sp. CGMCC 4.7035]WNB99602.1 CAP domain-containing protein [Streptomyces sp. CGMCC 4.7035]